MRETAGSAEAPAARCRKLRRGSFISIPPSLVCLFDHLVGAGEQSEREGKAQRLCCPEVEGQIDFRSLLDRQVGGALTFENPPSVDGDLAIQIANAASIAH